MKILSLMLLFVNVQYEAQTLKLFKLLVVGAMMFMGMTGEVKQETGLQQFKPSMNAGNVGIEEEDNEISRPFDASNMSLTHAVSSNNVLLVENHNANAKNSSEKEVEEYKEPELFIEEDMKDDMENEEFFSIEGEEEKVEREAELELLNQENHPMNNIAVENVPSNTVQIVQAESSSREIAVHQGSSSAPSANQVEEVREKVQEEEHQNDNKQKENHQNNSYTGLMSIAAVVVLILQKERVKKVIEFAKQICGKLSNIMTIIWIYRTQVAIALSSILLVILIKYILSILPIIFFASIIGASTYLYLTKKEMMEDFIQKMRKKLLEFSTYLAKYFKNKNN